MVLGFESPKDFQKVVGWELYQVTIDKYHVMFWFEGGQQLLNVAHSFSHRLSDSGGSYTFEIYGKSEKLKISRILRRFVIGVTIPAKDRLGLSFDNGDDLIIHDDPETRSWWFMPFYELSYRGDKALSISDIEPEEA